MNAVPHATSDAGADSTLVKKILPMDFMLFYGYPSAMTAPFKII